MKTSDVDLRRYSARQMELANRLGRSIDPEADLRKEELIGSINSTPIGRLLTMIASLPDVRHEKVSDTRRQIEHDQYDLGDNLDLAIDKILEEFIADC